MEMKLEVIVIIAVLLFSFSRGEEGSTFGKKIDRKPNEVDTLWISDSSLQIVNYGRRAIKSIRVVNTKNSEFESQSVDFYENGLLERVNMKLDSKLDSTNGYKVYIYDINNVNFSDKGEVTKALFMKDFKVVLKYSPKKG